MKQENSSLFINSTLKNDKMGVENQTKTQVWKDSSLCSETSTKNAAQELRLWMRVSGREESGGAGADQRAAGARQVHHGSLQVSQENWPRRLAA